MGLAEPPEHWAPPESLDPTPTWKQYLLVGLLIAGFLGVAAVWAFFALAPDLATPPALVAGNRVVLSAADHPPGTVKLVEVAGKEVAFYLVNARSDISAVRERWTTELNGGLECTVKVLLERSSPPPPGAPPPTPLPLEKVGQFTDTCTQSAFNYRGEVLAGPARRNLDRYLVSRKNGRFVVTLERMVMGAYQR